MTAAPANGVFPEALQYHQSGDVRARRGRWLPVESPEMDRNGWPRRAIGRDRADLRSAGDLLVVGRRVRVYRSSDHGRGLVHESSVSSEKPKRLVIREVAR